MCVCGSADAHSTGGLGFGQIKMCENTTNPDRWSMVHEDTPNPNLPSMALPSPGETCIKVWVTMPQVLHCHNLDLGSCTVCMQLKRACSSLPTDVHGRLRQDTHSMRLLGRAVAAGQCCRWAVRLLLSSLHPGAPPSPAMCVHPHLAA